MLVVKFVVKSLCEFFFLNFIHPMGLENLAQGLKNSAFFVIMSPVYVQFQLETVKSSLQKSYWLGKPANYFSTKHLKDLDSKILVGPFLLRIFCNSDSKSKTLLGGTNYSTHRTSVVLLLKVMIGQGQRSDRHNNISQASIQSILQWKYFMSSENSWLWDLYQWLKKSYMFFKPG